MTIKRGNKVDNPRGGAHFPFKFQIDEGFAVLAQKIKRFSDEVALNSGIVVEGIFRNDDIKTIKNIGKEKKKILNSMGIKTIQDLHEYDASLHNLTKKETAYLKQALDNSTVYQDEDRPIIKKNHPFIDFFLHSSTYCDVEYLFKLFDEIMTLNGRQK